MSSLLKKLFLIGALSLGLILMARAIPARAASQVEGENGSWAISGEFTSSSVKADSEERTFTTPPAGGGGPTVGQPISAETTFQTLPSDGEGIFTTASAPVEPPGGGGGGGNSGGGGGGGSGSGSRRISATAIIPTSPTGECPIYLTKFIRFGAQNDLIEVLKLQRFLRDFEEMNVPVDGIYGEVTFEAVKAFQLRYASAILKPWGIDYPTGYVYITTTLAINNLACERDPATTLDLRSRLVIPSNSGPEGLSATTTATSTPPFLEMGVATPPVGGTNRFFLATLGVLDFFKHLPDWWEIILFLLIGLTIVIRRASSKDGKGP